MDASRIILDDSRMDSSGLSFDSIRVTVPPTERRCEPDWSWSARTPVTDFDLWLVENGEAQMKLNGECWELSSGDVVLLTPGAKPEATHRPDRPLHVHFTHFLPLRGRRVLMKLPEVPGSRRWHVRETPALFEAMRRAGRRAHEPRGEECARGWLEAVLRDVLEQLIRPEALLQDETLTRLVAAVRMEPTRHWTVAEMARACCWSPQHLTRRFRAATGRAPMEFVIRERVRQAEQALRESSEPLKRIAERLGYADVYYFHRQFRRMTGRTPGQVRHGS